MLCVSPIEMGGNSPTSQQLFAGASNWRLLFRRGPIAQCRDAACRVLCRHISYEDAARCVPTKRTSIETRDRRGSCSLSCGTRRNMYFFGQNTYILERNTYFSE